jgi:hypothetical protein
VQSDNATEPEHDLVDLEVRQPLPDLQHCGSKLCLVEVAAPVAVEILEEPENCPGRKSPCLAVKGPALIYCGNAKDF